MFLYFAVGIASGFVKTKISKDNRLSLIFMVITSTIAFEIISNIFNMAIYGIEFEILYLLKVVIIEVLYNMFITYMLFRPLMYWGEMINRSRDGYYLLH